VAARWGRTYPQAVRVFESAWDRFTPFFAFTAPVRKLLYTTNGVESLNYQLRKDTKARGHFPGDAVIKLLWLAILNIEDKCARERALRKEKTGNAPTSPPASSRASAPWAGAKPSTNSISPTQDGSGKEGSPSPGKDLYTPSGDKLGADRPTGCDLRSFSDVQELLIVLRLRGDRPTTRL
jgi:hypothetical protein